MRKFIISLLATVLFFAGISAQAASNITLPATYQIVGQQQTANGTTAFSIQMSITNPGTTVLSHLSIYPTEPQLQSPFDEPPLMASLAAGTTVARNLNLESLTPQLAPGMFLTFQGMAADATGQPVEVLINSWGMSR